GGFPSSSLAAAVPAKLDVKPAQSSEELTLQMETDGGAYVASHCYSIGKCRLPGSSGCVHDRRSPHGRLPRWWFPRWWFPWRWFPWRLPRRWIPWLPRRVRWTALCRASSFLPPPLRALPPLPSRPLRLRGRAVRRGSAVLRFVLGGAL